MIVQMFIHPTELVIPTGTQTNEANAEIAMFIIEIYYINSIFYSR